MARSGASRSIAVFFFFASGQCVAASPQIDAREAALLDSQGKCAESEPYYRRALAEGTPSPALLNNAGNHYLLCGTPEKARLHFARLLESNRNHPNANLQLARIAASQKQGAAALVHLARIKDDTAPVLLVRAEALHLVGKSDAARSVLDRIETLAAGNPDLLAPVGALFVRIGDYERAEQALKAALESRPADFELLLAFSRAAARANHYERARGGLEAALRMKPEHTDALVELGLVHAALQDYNRAVYLLAQARQKAPRRPEIALALARAAEDAGFYGDSALAYDDYVRLQPDDEAARRDRARVLGYTGARLEEGLKEMAVYVERRPGDPKGHYNLAQFSWRTHPEKSLDQLATALRLDPAFAPAHVARAWLLHRLGRSAEAVPHLEAALKTAPNDVRALDQLGIVYLALDRPEEAETFLRRALAAAPQDPQALLHLGRALMSLGREDEAQKLLQQYQNVRPLRQRDVRKEPGMIEMATQPAAQRRAREIERFRSMSRSRPDDPVLQAHLGALLLADGALDDALAEFRRLLAMNADDTVWEQAGRALLQAEQYDLARQFLERAAVTRPGARLDLAMALLRTAGPDAALQSMENIPAEGQEGNFLLLKARILDASGRASDAQKLLSEHLFHSTLRPEIVQQGATLLARYGRHENALKLLLQAVDTSPDDAELLLAHASVLALMGRSADAQKRLKEIESRWPEWDRPYLAHGLVLEQAGRKSEAQHILRVAAMLGSRDPAIECALLRLESLRPPDPQCACHAGLRDWIFPSCSSR